jgi:hypothetical protein
MGVGLEFQAGQRFGEVARTYLASSTRAMDSLGEAQITFFAHTFLPGIFYYVTRRVAKKLKILKQNLKMKNYYVSVILAKARIYLEGQSRYVTLGWIPACAGMTIQEILQAHHVRTHHRLN